jgi:hypothetical protein
VGVTSLLRQIDPELLTEEHAAELAGRILKHPMLATDSGQLAEVVQREDLIKVILALAAAAMKPAAIAAAAGAEATSTPSTPAPSPTASNAEKALIQALKNAGISDPGATLDSIRMASMKMEAAKPELAAHVREAMAVIQQAESQFVARLNGAFDQTMERVSHSFTRHSRVWAVSISLALALILQLDSFQLLNRLAMDDTLRNTLVQQASGASASAQQLDQATQQNLAQLRQLATDSLITWPKSPQSWAQQMQQASIFGLLLTAALLSLGAPFWFNVLGDLLKLRPMLAANEDAQRNERQTSQAPAS